MTEQFPSGEMDNQRPYPSLYRERTQLQTTAQLEASLKDTDAQFPPLPLPPTPQWSG